MNSANWAVNLLVFLSFGALLTYTVGSAQGRQQLRDKSRQDWILDSCGLLIQGLLVPVLQFTVVYQFYHLLIPQAQALLDLPVGLGFLISFVLVDYLYYWNHRWLHGWAWRWHRLHHTVTDLDVLGTSRNSIWTSGLILYLWVHPLLLYLLAHPQGYLLGMGLTSALDLWRHSSLYLPSRWSRWLRGWLILPQAHAWHHATYSPAPCNYSANFNWDRWHGTAYQSDLPPKRLGQPLQPGLLRQLFWP
jgi:sterol desaturase/sphingolipid hydroxylase (fatty acid hydroxylase superfamily)